MGMGDLVGARVKRVEDPAFLTGCARYVDDVKLPGMLHSAFVRSPHPHARITGVDTTQARALPGVHAVITGMELAAITEPITMALPFPDARAQSFHGLATDRARFVGDPVAIVVADTRHDAEDACDLVEVEYEPLPVSASVAQALAPAATPLFDGWDDNVQVSVSRTFGDVDRALAEADRIVREEFHQHRFTNAPMECRGIVADFHPGTGALDVYAATQIPHYFRVLMGPLIGVPVAQIHVLPVDIGGSFGLKWCVAREDIVVCAASKLLGRPVKWIEDRNENLVAAGQAREETLTIEVGVTNDGDILGFKVSCVMDHGAYSGFPLPGALFLVEAGAIFPSCYRIGAYAFDLTSVCTNKPTYVALRGPWASETWVRERMLDVVARELGLDPADIRRRNLIRADELPTRMAVGATLDVSASAMLERALELVGYDAFRERQQATRADGRYVGIGLTVLLEPGGGPPDIIDAWLPGMGNVGEPARVQLEGDGTVTVFTGQSPHGQGHRTTLAQVAAEELGISFEQVRVVTGDTRSTPYSLYGTGGSRSASITGGAVATAARAVREQVLLAASTLLEAAVEDLDITDGMVGVRGVPDRAVPVSMVAQVAYSAPFMLPAELNGKFEASTSFPTGGAGSWTVAVHCCIAEVDADTGLVRIDRYIVIEDCGRMINPAIVEGQIVGGIVQGIGAVLFERSAYDDDGQSLAGTFLDYLIPAAAGLPRIEIEHVQAESDNPFNIRGVGEGGMIAAPAALTNAIEDALAEQGVRITEQYLPPFRLLELGGFLS